MREGGASPLAARRRHYFPMDMKKELLLYGIHLLSQALLRTGRRVGFEDLRVALHVIPRQKYDSPIFADLEDLRTALGELIAEGLVEEVGSGYAVTPKGETAALEVEKWDVGYAGHMRRVVEKSVRRYLRLELLILDC